MVATPFLGAGWVAGYEPVGKLHVPQAGGHRFGSKASNGKIIAVGEAYERKSACMNGIESINRTAPDAALVEVEG